jgi:hypothetical protein
VETEFKYGNFVLPLERIKIKGNPKLVKVSQDVVTMKTALGVIYYTPSKSEMVFPSPFRTITGSLFP